MLETQCRTTIAGVTLEYEFYWQSPAQVLCATRSRLVFCNSSRYVGRYPRVEAIVAAPQDVEAVVQGLGVAAL